MLGTCKEAATVYILYSLEGDSGMSMHFTWILFVYYTPIFLLSPLYISACFLVSSYTGYPLLFLAMSLA